MAKFFWLLVQNRVSPTQADNVLTWECAVIVASLVAEIEVNFAHMATKTLDIGLIRDEANIVAPRGEPHVEVPLLGTDLVADVEQMQGDDLAPPATTNMPQLPHLQLPLVSLRADLDTLLAPPETETKLFPAIPIDNTVLDALFRDEILPPASSHHAGKCPRYSRASDDTEARRVGKKERQQTEAAQKASIVDEELHQQQAREIGVGASSSMSTTDGVVRVDMSTTDGAVRVDVSTTEGVEMVDVATTDGDPCVDLSGFEKPDPLIC
uniref:Integrase core domain containing protein n=1 Tax=Solanum tuberosum TaxID=4113 RepID=M1DYK1_SOLTU